MSDLYLELRSKIAVVAAKTHLGSARIEEAQKRVGLSNEAIARKIPVSEKTWRRWKIDGTIPTAVLPAVAAALRLELREIQPENENGASPEVVSPESFAALDAKVDRILALLEPPDAPADQDSATEP